MPSSTPPAPPPSPVAVVAEDEMLIRELIAEDLADAGFAVTTYATADDAAAALNADAAVDLLFTDVRMPGSIDGWELGRRARALRPGLKVIYATGYSDGDPSLGPDERKLLKPYRYDSLLDVLRSLELI